MHGDAHDNEDDEFSIVAKSRVNTHSPTHAELVSASNASEVKLDPEMKIELDENRYGFVSRPRSASDVEFDAQVRNFSEKHKQVRDSWIRLFNRWDEYTNNWVKNAMTVEEAEKAGKKDGELAVSLFMNYFRELQPVFPPTYKYDITAGAEFEEEG